MGYLGTINGIHAYSARVMINQALLCSSQLIRSINYNVVHGEGDVVDFSFVDGDDLANSRVRLRFSQNIEWADMPVVKFQFYPRWRCLRSERACQQGDLVRAADHFLSRYFDAFVEILGEIDEVDALCGLLAYFDPHERKGNFSA